MKHAIRIAVSINGSAGSATLYLEGDDDAFDEADPADFAEALCMALHRSLTGTVVDDEDDEDEVLLALPEMFDAADEDKPN